MVEESFTPGSDRSARSFAYSGIFIGSETAAFHLGSIEYYN